MNILRTIKVVLIIFCGQFAGMVHGMRVLLDTYRETLSGDSQRKSTLTPEDMARIQYAQEQWSTVCTERFKERQEFRKRSESNISESSLSQAKTPVMAAYSAVLSPQSATKNALASGNQFMAQGVQPKPYEGKNLARFALPHTYRTP